MDKEDIINNPSHYTQGKVECTEAIRSAVGDEGYEAFLRGNIIKYIWRYPHKNGLEDLKKAQTYINMLIDLKSNNQS
tara:strand:- start:2457 stop:2687 length:231 start_codon:yes stop_codon:yes gene_type:complete